VPSQLVRSRKARWSLRYLAIAYVAVLVVVPVGMVFGRAINQGGQAFVDAMTSPDSLHAFQLTAIVAGSAVVINTVFGIVVALLLARYRFPGKRLLNVIIDLPISVSPIVVGLALILVFGFRTGWFGPTLRNAGFQVIFATPGMILATSFVALPLVVRELLPVLQETGLDQEQAARSLGATALQRFRRITVPTIKWALAYGVVLSIARCIGEFGAVRVVSGNVTGKTQTVTLLVDQHAEQFEGGAYQLSVVLILFAALCIVLISFIRPAGARR
jgi:sulfate transport system permease protein